MANQKKSRRLVRAKLTNKYKPKENPFEEGRFQVGLKFEIYDGEETIQDYVNLDSAHSALSGYHQGRLYWLLCEWSAKAKGKDGTQGAWKYRHIDTSCIEQAYAGQANGSSGNGASEETSGLLKVGDIRKAFVAVNKMLKVREGAKRSFLSSVLRIAVSTGDMEKKEAQYISEGLKIALVLLKRLGIIFAQLTPALKEDE